MTIATLNGFPQEHSCVEYTCGRASETFTYPGVSQCLTLTGIQPNGLLGTHISPGSTQDDVDAIITYLRSAGGANATRWYIVGQFKKHFQHSRRLNWTSILIINSYLRRHLSDTSHFYYYDTSTLCEKKGWSWGVDIKAHRQHPDVNISFARAMRSPKNFEALSDPFYIMKP